MRIKRFMLLLGGMVVIVAALAFCYPRLLVDGNGKPYCHKGFMFGFKSWMLENGLEWIATPTPFRMSTATVSIPWPQ
jgi:uncharacterized membrane protein